jgi:hypothetical protein
MVLGNEIRTTDALAETHSRTLARVRRGRAIRRQQFRTGCSRRSPDRPLTEMPPTFSRRRRLPRRRRCRIPSAAARRAPQRSRAPLATPRQCRRREDRAFAAVPAPFVSLSNHEHSAAPPAPDS